MPYIAPELREKFDPLIDALAESLVEKAWAAGSDAAFAGMLNYTCTRLALKVARDRFGPLRYWLIALLSGIFKNIGDEFYRRVAAPYEDRQMAQSGDVDLYRKYLAEIEND
jgi:hypothetical protein